MKVFNKNRGNLLYKLLSIVLLGLSIITPVYNYFNFKPSRTDTFTYNAVSEIKSLEHVKQAEISTPNTDVAVEETPVYYEPAAVYAAAPANNITIAGRVIPLYYNDYIYNVTPPAGIAYQYTGANVIYGHNSYDVFGGLEDSIYEGMQFTVTLDGVTSVYSVTGTIKYASGSISAPPRNGIRIVTCGAGVTEANASPDAPHFVIKAVRL